MAPDMQINQNNNTVTVMAGFYDMLTKEWQYTFASNYYRFWTSWYPGSSGYVSTMAADISGKAGSYRNNVSVTIYDYSIQIGGLTFAFISTQWSFF